MTGRQEPKKGKPRTGTGDAPRGKKPKDVGLLRMVSAEGGIRRKQPKGWGIAKVVDIFTRKER